MEIEKKTLKIILQYMTNSWHLNFQPFFPLLRYLKFESDSLQIEYDNHVLKHPFYLSATSGYRLQILKLG